MIKLTEIRTVFEKEKPDNLFLQYFEWVKTLIPFWKQAVTRIAELNGTAEKKGTSICESSTILWN